MIAKIIRLYKKDIENLGCVNFIDINIVRRKLDEESVIFAAMDEEGVCGIISIEPVGATYRLAYLHVIKEKRRRGIGTALVDAVRIFDPKIHLEEGDPVPEEILSFLDFSGFRLNREMDVFCFDRTPETMEFCRDFMEEHGRPVMRMMKRHGFGATPMGMAGPGLIERLGDEIGSGFDEEMNPFNIRNLDEDWSYIVHKDDIPAAFVACTHRDDMVSIEMLCSHRDYLAGGPGMMALMTILERIYRDGSVMRASTAVRKEHKDMIRMLDARFYDIIKERKNVKVFTLAE